MPFDDWQFWVVTMACLAGLVFIARPLLPSKKKSGACPGCATGSAATAKKRPRKVSLTVENKRV